MRIWTGPRVDESCTPRICRWGQCLRDARPGFEVCEKHQLKYTPRSKNRRPQFSEESFPRGYLCSIYAIKGGEFVKIGRTRDVQSRLGELRTSSPILLELLGHVDGAVYTLEKGLHSYLMNYRARGEWFHLRGEVLTVVALMRDKDLLRLMDLSERAPFQG